jgi:predicted transcriptional regulator
MNTSVLNKSLAELGLDDFEIELYLLLMDKINPSITILAKSLGVQRLHVYQALEKMQSLGLLVKNDVKDKNKLLIELENPNRISSLLKQKESQLRRLNNDLEQVLPGFVSRFFQPFRNSAVRIYQGKNQFEDFFSSILSEEKQQIYHFGSNDAIVDLLGWESAQDWVNDRVKQNIATKELIFSSHFIKSRQEKDIEELRQIKYLPKNYEKPASYLIYNDKVAIWNALVPRIVVISDPVIQELFKANFEILWDVVE